MQSLLTSLLIQWREENHWISAPMALNRPNAPELGASFLCLCVLWRLWCLYDFIKASIVPSSRERVICDAHGGIFLGNAQQILSVWIYGMIPWTFKRLRQQLSSARFEELYPELKIPVQEIGYLWLTDFWFLAIHDTAHVGFLHYYVCSHEQFATRPGTRPIPVAGGWAEAEMAVFALSTDYGRTNWWTDNATYRVASPRLKKKEKFLPQES